MVWSILSWKQMKKAFRKPNFTRWKSVPKVGLSVSLQILQVLEKSLRIWLFVCPHFLQQYPFSHFSIPRYSSQSRSVLKRSANSNRFYPLKISILFPFYNTLKIWNYLKTSIKILGKARGIWKFKYGMNTFKFSNPPESYAKTYNTLLFLLQTGFQVCK